MGLGRWLHDRMRLGPITQLISEHKVPAELVGRKGWMYVFGMATLVAFLVQVVTGIALVTKYIPSPAHAHDSLLYINEQVWLGSLTRAMHFYGGSAMVLFVAIHAARVFLTGSYKFPREMSWISGVLLLVLVLGMAFSGQLLRWDQDGVWSVVVAAKWLGRVPLIGDPLADIVLAGETVGGTTLSRFFTVHIFVFPVLIVALIGLHLYLVYQNGISEPPKAGRPVDPAGYRQWYAKLKSQGGYYFPDVTWHESLFGFVVLLGILGLAVWLGPHGPGPEPDPTQVAVDPRPDWFLIWYYALIYVKPRGHEALVMVYLPVLIFVFLLLLPVLFRGGERSPSRRPWAVVAVGFIFVALGYFIWMGYRAPWVPRLATQPLPAAALQTTAPEVVEGSRIFHERGCQYCHQILGEGGIYGPDLTTAVLRMSPEEVTVRIVMGIGDMPAYRDILSTEELDAIMQLLRHTADITKTGRHRETSP